MSRKICASLAALAGIVTLTVLVGCTQSPDGNPAPNAPAPEGKAHGHTDMHSGVDGEEERKLYLTPGGKYTESDIKANGDTVPSVKFKGLKARHDAKPRDGDFLCPISMTKANPKFSWIIGGKSYQFCCPPCVDEFVALAKERPEEIREPGFYVKSSEKK